MTKTPAAMTKAELREALRLSAGKLQLAKQDCEAMEASSAEWRQKMFAARKRAREAETLLLELVKALVDDPAGMEAMGPPSNFPMHSHPIPGIWDWDNGDKAHTVCVKCALWTLVREKAIQIQQNRESNPRY